MVRIKKLYKIWSAFYNPSLVLWNNLFAKTADKELMRLLKKYVKDKSSILDVGVGTGNNIKRMKKLNIHFNTYEGIDLSNDMLDIAKKSFSAMPNITLRMADITEEPLTKKYDAIISTWVFSHLKQPEKIIKKLQTALNKDGHIILLFLSERTEKFFLKSFIDSILKFFSSTSVLQKNIDLFPKHEYKKVFKWLGGNISLYVFSQSIDR